MMSRFMDIFGKDASVSKNIPAEVLEHLNSKLPGNLMYCQDKHGNYMVIPRPESQAEGLKLTTQLDLSDYLLNRLKLLSPVNWWTYFYRLQRPIPVKNLKIGNTDKVIPITETVGNPLQEGNGAISEAKIYPHKLPDPIMVTFESAAGAKIPISIQQQPYDSIAEIKLKNIDYPALKIEIYYFAPLSNDVSKENAHTSYAHPIHVIFSVFPSKARSVEEAVTALQLFKSLLDGTASIDGHRLLQKSDTSTLTPEQTEEAISFWSTLLELEEKLQVKFVPSAHFPSEDVQFYKELCMTLIKKKELNWKHPFDHFHMDGYTPANEEISLENLVGKEKITYKFSEGPIAASLLGTDFNLYAKSTLKGFVITNIAWDDEDKKGCEIYIADAPGDIITLSRLYITEAEHSKQNSK